MKGTSNLTLDIVIPVFNRENGIRELCSLVKDVVSGNFSFHMILVDDASTDNTWGILKEIKAGYLDQVTVIRLAKNAGQHNAILCGLQESHADLIVTMDDDMQHDPQFIPEMVELLQKEQYELVYAISESSVRRPYFRQFTSWLWKWGTKNVDTAPGIGSSYRIFTKGLRERLVAHNGHNRFFFDEIASWYTSQIGCIEVPYRKGSSSSRYSNRKLFKYGVDLATSYSIVPLKAIVLLGFSVSVFTFLLGIYYIGKKVFFHTALKGYTSTIVVLLFSTSLILLSIGLLGRYIGKVVELMNEKPQYTIREKQ